MLSFFKAFLPRPKVRNVAALQQFLDGEAAHLAQRTVIDFARNELGSLSAHAFADPRFQAKLAVSRWEGFASALADMIVLVHACLQAAGAPRPQLDVRLGDLYAAILADHPVPEHRPQGWDAEITTLRGRLSAQAGTIDPQGYAAKTGGLVFKTLPFAPRDPVENRMVLCNAFAFGLIAFNDRLRRLLVAPSVCDDLVAAGP
ncbi:MAG: hypothetical protein KIT25_03525 [Enhydrobacter sp.]|nr:MAG: hypothetical protein KIT25_03525 [Enhydrobacter sp.]